MKEKICSWPTQFKVKTHHFNQYELPKEWLKHAFDHKWFKPFVAKEYNGMGCSIGEGLKLLIYTNSIFGGLGWCVNLGAGANYFSGFFNNEGATKIFNKDNAVLAGSGNIATEFKAVEGGFIASGLGTKATGALHATHFTFNGKLEDGSFISCCIEAKDVTILKDWKLFGLKASSSFGYEFKNVFVPHSSTFQIDVFKNASTTSVHYIPFDVFAKLCMSASAIGLAKGLLQTAEADNSIASRATKSLIKLQEKVRNHTQSLQHQAELVSKQIAEKADAPSTQVNDLITHIGRDLFECVNNLYFEAGLVMADENKVVHHKYKDFMLGIQHFLFKA